MMAAAAMAPVMGAAIAPSMAAVMPAMTAAGTIVKPEYRRRHIDRGRRIQGGGAISIDRRRRVDRIAVIGGAVIGIAVATIVDCASTKPTKHR